MKFKTLASAIAVCVAMAASAATAATFQFSYVASFGTAMGTFDGNLNTDGDTINDMSNMWVELSTNTGVTNVGNPLMSGGFWSLSGLNAAFGTGSLTPAGFGAVAFAGFGIVGFGDPSLRVERYNAQNATVQLAVVPVPASLPLLAAGLGGLGFLARRKRMSA